MKPELQYLKRKETRFKLNVLTKKKNLEKQGLATSQYC
jgi:hypothetical protein